MRPRPALIWTLLLACALLRAEPVESLITASDLLKVAHPSAPAVSPDGRTVAYTLRTIETLPSGDYAYRNRLWLATLSGDTAPVELTAAGPQAYMPAWHPSGDRIAYVRPESADVARVWILPVAGGEPYPVTPPLRDAARPLWSPDGNRLLFTATVSLADLAAAPAWPSEKPAPAGPPDPAPQPAAPPPKDAKPPEPPAPSPDGNLAARRAWLELNETRGAARVSHRLDFNDNPDGRGLPAFTHVFVIDRAGAAPVDLTPRARSYAHPAWLADSRAFVCSSPADESAHPDRALRRRLVRVDLGTAEARPLAESPAFSLDHPVVSPDGALVAFTAQPCEDPADFSYGQTRLAVAPAAGGEPRILTAKFDRSASAPAWSADGRHLYFTAESAGAVPLHRVPAAGGNTDRITGADTWITAFSVGKDDLALVMARPVNPGELYRSSLAGRSSRILTSHNTAWLSDKRPASAERRKIKQPDGVEIDYWLMRPPYLEGGFHYPLLVMVHGGPASMWGAAEPDLWHDWQYFAARGYAIAFANPRGSSGYGAKFQRASFQNWADGPAADVLAAAGAAAKDSWVDEDRQVILGGSYGAYLAAWILSTDQRFKAAAVARGVYDLTTFLGQGDAWPLVPWHFGGYPWQPGIRRLLDAQSPITRADRIRTPLLIKQNEADRQTGPAQGDLLYRSLKLLERPVELVRYPGATHNLGRSGDPARRLDRLVRLDEFFQRFIGAPARAIPPPPAAGK